MACELAIDTKSKPAFPGLTLYSKPGRHCLGKDVGVYIPSVSLDKTGKLISDQLNVVLWLHGMDVRTAMDFFRANASKLREQVRDSGTAVVVVVPHLGYRYWGTNEAGETIAKGDKLALGAIESDGGLFLDGVLDALPAALAASGGSAAKLTMKHLVVACHSGGGALMRRLVGRSGDFAGRLRACWGFDCLYSGDDAKFWYEWKKANPAKELFIVYGTGTADGKRGTIRQSVWLYLMGKGLADEAGKILDPAEDKRKVSGLHVLIAHSKPSASDTDTLVDGLLFPAPSGGKRAAPVATVADAVANLLRRHSWPSDIHYFTTTFFQDLLKTAKLP